MSSKGEKTRGSQIIGTVTYQDVADWTGLSIHWVRKQAQAGQFPDVVAALTWVNSRRQRDGLPLIGEPAEPNLETGSDPGVTVASDPLVLPANTGYNPLTGTYSP